MKKYLYITIGLLFIAGVVWLVMTPGKPSKYDQFAQCIRDKKTVTFFGAFWCPHCQAQKARFGKSAQYLPYVECSTPDSQGQTQVCKDNGITTYPTWDFATGTTALATTTTRHTGEMELVDLAEVTECELPQ
jgi:thiol-disulfide isomerase/thioredoxin